MANPLEKIKEELKSYKDYWNLSKEDKLTLERESINKIKSGKPIGTLSLGDRIKTLKEKKKKQKDYGGKYDDIMEGDHLIVMRGAIEDLRAKKITKKQYNEIKKGFLNEFPKSAIKRLELDISMDAIKAEKAGKKE